MDGLGHVVRTIGEDLLPRLALASKAASELVLEPQPDWNPSSLLPSLGCSGVGGFFFREVQMLMATEIQQETVLFPSTRPGVRVPPVGARQFWLELRCRPRLLWLRRK